MAFTLCRLVARATQEACRLEALALASPPGPLALSLLSPLEPHQLDLVLLARLLLAKRSLCQHLELPPPLRLAPQALALEPQILDKARHQLLAKAVLQRLGKHQLLAHSPLQLLEAPLVLHRALQPLEEAQRPTHLVSPHLLLAPAVALALAPLSRAPQGLVPHKARQPLAAQASEALVKAVLLHLEEELPQLLPLGSSPSSRARLPFPSVQGVALGPHSSPQGLAQQPPPPALALPLHPASATCLATTSRASRSPAALAALVSQTLLEGLEHPARQGLVRASPTASLGLLHSRPLLLAAPMGSLHLPLARQVLVSPHSSSSSRSCSSLSSSSSSLFP